MNRRQIREIVAVVLAGSALLMTASLLSHSPVDPSPFHTSTLSSRPDKIHRIPINQNE